MPNLEAISILTFAGVVGALCAGAFKGVAAIIREYYLGRANLLIVELHVKAMESRTMTARTLNVRSPKLSRRCKPALTPPKRTVA